MQFTMGSRSIIYLIFPLLIIHACNSGGLQKGFQEPGVYLNHNDTVKYVGREACKECHILNYLSYLRTGMGLSFDTATPQKSAAVVGPDSILFDPYKNLYYLPFWEQDTLFIMEFRLEGKDTVHKRIERVDYVVGSGQHTNSHIYLSGSYAYQVPFTYYTQDGRFDFPPGFEDGQNSRFSRKIGLECMSCHNAFPDFIMGSENKYHHIPDGIDCERCHGPGEAHVRQFKQGIVIDTSKYIDYSIVNPGKLDPELQTDLCARCHLQGTMVLKPGKSFYDFKPGMRLTNVMDIFMPLFEGGKDDFIMASHYERMSQSKCYIESNNGFNCITCHNPHKSRVEVQIQKYLRVCAGCHSEPQTICSEVKYTRDIVQDNCIHCHMREEGSRDIPHVKVHDHKISVAPYMETPNSERIFKGLVAVNNPQTDSLTMARGYLLEYETYHPDPQYLDSAWTYLQATSIESPEYYFNALVNYYFLKNYSAEITKLIEKKGIRMVLDSLLITEDYSNNDAWTAYRIGQAYQNENNQLVATYFYRKAADLAKFNLEFQNKLGSLFVMSGKLSEAEAVFDFILGQDKRYTSAWVNLGFIKMSQKQWQNAEKMLLEALKLDPDNIQAMVNLAAVYLETKRKQEAWSLVKRINTVDPNNYRASQLKILLEN